MRTAEDTGTLLALLFRRSGQRRARISEKTLKMLGGRVRLKGAFVTDVQDALFERGYLFTELAAGGYGLWPSTTLEGAPAVTIRRYMWDDFRSLRTDPEQFQRLAAELDGEGEEPTEDDD